MKVPYPEKAPKDVKDLHEILNRQGIDFYLAILAEHVALSAQRFGLEHKEVLRIRDSIITEFKEHLAERT